MGIWRVESLAAEIHHKAEMHGFAITPKDAYKTTSYSIRNSPGGRRVNF